ncbi:MAG: MotA/TolQ/ExbB proton channel family protein [Candidatus Falkowbacteria bacterium]
MSQSTKKWSLFLRWWIVFALIVLGSAILLLTGLFAKINEADFTKISFLIYAVFFVFTIRNGLDARRLSGQKVPMEKKEIDSFFRANDMGHFASKSLFVLGMIGTVFGLIYMLSSVSSLDPSNAIAAKNAMTEITMGMATAFYTTGAGLILSLILEIQLFDTKQHLDKLYDEISCEDECEAKDEKTDDQ